MSNFDPGLLMFIGAIGFITIAFILIKLRPFEFKGNEDTNS